MSGVNHFIRKDEKVLGHARAAQNHFLRCENQQTYMAVLFFDFFVILFFQLWNSFTFAFPKMRGSSLKSLFLPL
jgi:hypothetical protein